MATIENSTEMFDEGDDDTNEESETPEGDTIPTTTESKLRRSAIIFQSTI